MNIIRLKNVNKVYKTGKNTLYALSDINVDINSGDFTAIIGKSGSGKSTLMNIMGCLDLPSSGEYYFCEKNIRRLSDKSLAEIRNKKIGFIFQSFNLIPTLTALENVELPLVYRGIDIHERRKRALSALSAVGLENRITHKPRELSGGQQQRVAIARALALSPEIILADEPTGNLDTAAGEDVMRLLKKLNSHGRTIVLITHDNGIAANADNRIVISDGKIVSEQQPNK